MFSSSNDQLLKNNKKIAKKNKMLKKELKIFDKELKTAIRAARASEKIALKYFNIDKGIKIKKDKSPVTIADEKIQEKIIKILKKQFPDDGILGEEQNTDNRSTKRIWIIDPIDGTADYINNLPEFAICIALVNNEDLVLGVVFAPILKKLYYSVKGEGAFLNGKKIQVSCINDLRNATITLTRHANSTKKEIINLFGKKKIIGSEALRICYIAEGIAEAHIYTKKGDTSSIFLWDVAAAEIILREASGTITNLESKKINYNSINPRIINGLLATNAEIYPMLQKIIKKNLE